MQRKVRETSRQLMALLLAAAMCVTLLPSTVLAAGDETTEEGYELTEEMTEETEVTSEKDTAEAETAAQEESQAEEKAEDQGEVKVLSETEKPEEEEPEVGPQEDDNSGDGVVKIYAGIGYEGDGIAPMADEWTWLEDNLADDASITVTVYVKDDSGNWVVYDPNVTYSRDTEFQFQLTYDIDGSNESKMENGEYYELPNGLDITSAVEGTIYDQNNRACGTYTIVDGVVHFQYDQDWVDKYAGDEVIGHFTFTATLDSSITDDEKDADLNFPGVSDPIVIPLEDGKVTAEKSHSINSEDGTVTFTITFTVSGETSTVALTDTLGSNLSFVAGSFLLDDVDVSDSVTYDGNTLKATFEELSIGEHTFTYTVKVDDTSVLDDTSNTAEYEWTVKGSDEPTGNGEVTDNVTFQKSSLTKSGTDQDGSKQYTFDEDGNLLITWTIIVTPDQFSSVLGTTVTDTFGENQSYVQGSMQVTRQTGWWSDVTDQGTLTVTDTGFTYVFPTTVEADGTTYDGTTDRGVSYQITYQTKVLKKDLPAEGESAIYRNDAEDGNDQDDAEVTFDGDEEGEEGYDIVTKEGSDPVDQGDDKYQVNYTITINPADLEGVTNVTLTDQLDVDYSATANAKYNGNVTVTSNGTALNLGTDYTITYYKYVDWHYEVTTDPAEASEFVIIFIGDYNPLTEIVEITYGVIYDLSNSNDGEHHIENDVKTSYTIDEEDYNEDDDVNIPITKHGDDELKKEGSLSGTTATWTLYVNYSENGQYGAGFAEMLENALYTVTDQLPKGMKLVDGSVSYVILNDDGNEGFGTSKTPDEGYVVYTYDETSNTITFTIDLTEENVGTIWYGGYYFVITYQTEVTEAYEDGQTFQNDAKYKKGEETLGEDSEKVTVEKKELDKTAAIAEGAINQIEYTIYVNYYGEDLDPNSDTLTLTDTLPSNVTLLADSIKVTKLFPDEDGDAVDYNVSYSLNDDGSGQLVFTVPDSVALKIVYCVNLTGKTGDTVEVKNDATLKGSTEWKDENDFEYEIQDSEADVRAEDGDLIIHKIDSGEMTKSLAGATFELHIVGTADDDLTAGGELVATVTTENSGTAEFKKLAQNVLYYYVETKAPDGYSSDEVNQRNYFILCSDTSSEEYQALIKACEDAGLNVATIATFPYVGGYTLNVPNDEGEEPYASITLTGKKIYEGADLEEGMFSFTVKDEDGNVVSTGSAGADGKITFTEITYDINDVGNHTYTVTEDSGDLENVKYSQESYTVNVTVTYNEEDNTLSAEVTSNNQNSLDFTNVYDETYGFDLNKVDDRGNVLDGAKFTLTDKDGNQVKFVVSDDGLTYTASEEGTVTVIPGNVHVEGLEAGTYTLTETQAPDGNYKGIDPITIQVGDATLPEKISSMWNSVLSFFGAETISDDAVVVDRDNTEVTVVNQELVDIEGKKEWDDNDDHDGKRPESVTLYLYGTGVGFVKDAEGNYVTATAKPEDWSFSFTGLPKYDSYGNEITYYVIEASVDGYTTTYERNDDGTITITNKHDQDYVSLNIVKDWSDQDNAYGKRPKNLTIYLYANDELVEGTQLVLNEENQWSGSFDNLPKYDENGDEIIYTVKEESVDGYTGRLITIGANSYIFVFENEYNPDYVDVEGHKTWLNDDPETRPESITIHLFADDKEIDSVTVTAANDWTWSFTDLPRYDETDGHEIKYTITEDVVEGYTSEIDGYDVTNTGTEDKTYGFDLDKVDEEGNVLDGATFTLTDADGNQITFVKNADGSYTASEEGTITEIPGNVHVDGLKEGTYTLHEETVPDGYQSVEDKQITVGPSGVTVLSESKSLLDSILSFFGTGADDPAVIADDDSVTVTNYKPETVDVEGSKTWNDNEDAETIRPISIQISLLADGEPALDDNGNAITATVTEADDWAWSFTDLPKYAEDGHEIEYTITEAVVDGYETTVDGYDVTNTLLRDITVIKDWEDNDNQDGLRPEDIIVNLLGNGKVVDTATLTESNKWSHTFTDLPVYDESGKEIDYTVKENSVHGYEETVGELTKNADGSYSITLTNKHEPEYVDVEGKKTWNDNNDENGVRPTEITIDLLADGVVIETKTVTEADDWAWSFENLPKYKDGVEIVYTIAETVIEGYETEVHGYDVINSYREDKTSLNVNKLWTDEDDEDGFRPDKITVNLFADGQIIETIELSEDNEWAHSFTELPKYDDNGNEIVYTITEDEVEGYETVIRQVGNTTTYIIDNTHKPEKVNINGTKYWDDKDNQDGIRPAYIVIRLYEEDENGDLVEIAHTTTTAVDDWNWSFTNLPKYKDGVEIKYVISEDAVAGYDTELTYDEEETKNIFTNSHKPEQIDLEGSKTWDDDDNRDGKRPESITIHLFADGVPALDENGKEIVVTVTEADNWEWNFTGLDKYADGKEIEYTITEDEIDVDGYTTEIDGMKVVNGYIPEYVDVEGKKTWNDNDDQDGKRPTSITIHLYADGDEIGSQTITDGSNGWSWSFKDLPKYRDGGEEIVYTVKEDVVADYETEYVDDSYDVINNYKPETIEVSGLKTWVDNNNQDNVRPSSITIRLLADGEPAVDADGNEVEPAVITDADGWEYSFGNLPKYKDGVEIVYTIVEDSIDDYTTIIDGYDVTNYYRPGETGLNVHKMWSDNDDQDGIRPTEITIHLMKEDGDELVPVTDDEGKEITAVLDDSNNWAWSIDGLPENADGEKIVYTVTEDVPDGYKANIVQISGTTTIIIDNEHQPDEVKLEGEKTWDDNDDQDGIRPDYITIHLLADGQEIYHYNVTADEAWKWSFTGLDKYRDGGEKIEYTVVEEPIYGYELDEESSSRTVDDDGNIIYVLENDHIAEKTSASIKKVFDDADNQDGIRPETVTVRLMADGQPALDEQGNEITFTLSEGNNWSAGTDEILDVYRDHGTKIEYTFEEVETTEGYEFTIAEDGENSYEYTATNKHIPETIDISGVKEWSDDYNKNGRRPVSITVNLYADGIKIDKQTITGAVDNWQFSFTDLPKYKEGEEGVKIVYTVDEELVDGYDSEVKLNDDGTFTIINTEPQITKELQEDDYERKDQDIEHDDGNGDFEENVHDDGWGSWDDADNQQEVTYHVILDDIRNAVNLTVHDYLEDGLDFEPETVEIKLVDGDVSRTLEAGTDYTETEGACNDPNGCAMAGCTFEVHFADELFEDISEDAYLVITYKALTDTHEEDYDDYVDVILNFSYMTFGTMSYRSQIVTTETELFGFGVFKYTDADGDEVSVAGAQFILSQMRGESLMYATFDEEVDEETGETYYMVEGWYDHLDDAEILTTGEDGYIRIDGLDDDTYTLTEVSAPAGYQMLDEDIIVTIDEDGNVTFDGAAVNKEESLPHVGYVSNESVTPKFTKEILEDDIDRKLEVGTNLHDGENTSGNGWGTWDDADNDQVVNYRLTLSDIKGAAGVTVHDYLEPGLDFDSESVVVALYNSGDTGIVLNEGYEVTQGECTDPESTMGGCTFEVAFEDSVFADLNDDAYLVIYFNALTNTDADDYTNYKDEILNHAYMTYGNDFTRRSDVVTTETDLFGFAVYKYAMEDGNEVALSGAEFALGRADGKYATFEVGQDVNLDVTCYMVSDWVDSIDEAGTLTSGADGLIRILGLDDDSYTLVETKAPVGYDIIDEAISVTIDEDGNVTVSGDTGSKEVVIGKEVNVENQPKLVDIEIQKDWEDNGNQDGTRPEKITIRLYANGKPAVDANGDEIVVEIEPDANGDWYHKFENLPEYENGEEITYTVIEETITDYTPSYSHEETAREDREDGGQNDLITWTITNEHTPGQTSLYVYKLWTDGDDQDGIRPPEIMVNVLADGEPAKDVDGNEVPAGVLSEENGWEYSFPGLPEYADGEPIDYTIEEIVPDGYEVSYTYVDHSNVVIIDNTHETETIDVEGSKTWADNDDQDGKRPDYIIIRLYADGVEKDHVTVTEEDDWSWSFKDLPKYETVTDDEGNVTGHQEIKYTITEDAIHVDGYEVQVNGYDVINSYIPEKTEVSGEKIWLDYENEYQTRPKSITVNLYADGEKVDTLEVEPDEDGNWSFSFTDLDKYRDHGTEIEYTVTETVVPDYNTKVVRNEDGDYEITNTLVEPKITKEIDEDDYERKDDDIVHDDSYGHFEENVDGDGWGTWDDADNNQEVIYRLTLTDIKNAMNLTVHDYLEEGLDFEPDTVDIELYDGDSETKLVAGEDYTLTQGRCSDPECPMDSCTFEVAFEDSVFSGISDEAYLVITYKALADTSAEDYEDYEDDILNHSYMTFGSNVTLRSDVVTTETDLFGFGVYKYTDVDGEAMPLEGAEFALEKDGQYAIVMTDTDAEGNSCYMIEGWADELSDETTLISGEDGYIRIEGLDDDTYTLTETKAPAGYYKLAETITVVIDEDGNVTFDGAGTSKDNELPHVGLLENKPITPSFTKEIVEDDYERKEEEGHMHDGEDTNGDGWGTWDDADNDQLVNYRMTVTDIKDAVNMTVHDYLEDGLTFDADSVEVVLVEPGEPSVEMKLTEPDDYTLMVGKACTDPDCQMDGCTFEIHFEDSVFTGISENAYLVISYNAKADTKADDYEDYKDAILNHAYMTFGNDFTYRTDVVTTETDLFGFAVYKYAVEDGEEKALADAEFVLARGSEYATFKSDGDTYMVTGWTDDLDEAGILVSGEDGMIRIEGLDDDSYTLTETKAPDGYEIENESITVVIDEDGAVSVDGSTGIKESAVGRVVNVENKEKPDEKNPDTKNPTSGNGGNGGSGSGAPKTGDTNNIALWFLLLAASAVAAGTGVYMKKRKNQVK